MIEGVYRTRSGYSGGSLKDPTYQNLGDHTETIQIDFDPELISYKEILALFWNSHNPATSSWSAQYKAVIFYHNDEQKQAALQSKEELERKQQITVATEILPFQEFYMAEDYHQKYYLQGRHLLMSDMRSYYPDFIDIIHSTAAARLNGFIAGHGTADMLMKEIDSFGLTAEARKDLMKTVN